METLYFLLYCAKFIFPLLTGCVRFWNVFGEGVRAKEGYTPCIKTKTSGGASTKRLESMGLSPPFFALPPGYQADVGRKSRYPETGELFESTTFLQPIFIIVGAPVSVWIAVQHLMLQV